MRIGRDFKIGDRITYRTYNEKTEPNVLVEEVSLIVGWKEEREAVVENGIYKVRKGFRYLVAGPKQILPNPASNWELCKTKEQYSIEELLTSENDIYRSIGILLQKKGKAEEKRKLKYPHRY